MMGSERELFWAIHELTRQLLLCMMAWPAWALRAWGPLMAAPAAVFFIQCARERTAVGRACGRRSHLAPLSVAHAKRHADGAALAFLACLGCVGAAMAAQALAGEAIVAEAWLACGWLNLFLGSFGGHAWSESRWARSHWTEGSEPRQAEWRALMNAVGADEQGEAIGLACGEALARGRTLRL